VNAPPALAPPPPRLVDDEELMGLTALLELFSAEEPAAGTEPVRRGRRGPSLRARGARAWAWTRASSRRAASWGAGPQGAWRAW
jgi:hypothetical protein